MTRVFATAGPLEVGPSRRRRFVLAGADDGGGETPAVPLAQPNIHAGIGSFNHRLNAASDSYWLAFVAPESRTLKDLYLYVKTASGGYGADTNGDGDYGTIRVRVHEYDAATDGLGDQVGDDYQAAVPSETTNSGIHRCTDLGAALTAGVRYIAEVRNVDASPTAENFSVNSQHVRHIVGANDANVETNDDWPQGRTYQGLDPRVATCANGGWGDPSDDDGHCIPAFWAVWADSADTTDGFGQPRYSAGNGQGEPTSRTYTVTEDEAGLATHILGHGRGRAAVDGADWNVTVDVTVNDVEIASDVAMTGAAGVLAELPEPVTLAAGDEVTVTVSNVTNFTHPYMDNAMFVICGFSSKAVLPFCIIGVAEA